MSITGPGSVTAATIMAQTNMMNELNTLAEQLGTGKAAQTYSGLQSQAGLSVALNAQLAAIDGYSATTTTVSTTLNVAQTVLSQIANASGTVQSLIADPPGFSLNSSGQTQTQSTVESYLDQILSLLNTQVGSNYIFSGSGVNQQSVVNASTLLNGTGAQAGLMQLISEREQADLGTAGMGRLSTSTSGATVTLSQDGTPFGFQLTGVSSGLSGAVVSGPSGSPPSISVALGSNPNDGETINFQLTLPTAPPRILRCRRPRRRRRGRISSASVRHRLRRRPICRMRSLAPLPIWRRRRCRRPRRSKPAIISFRIRRRSSSPAPATIMPRRRR